SCICILIRGGLFRSAAREPAGLRIDSLDIHCTVCLYWRHGEGIRHDGGRARGIQEVRPNIARARREDGIRAAYRSASGASIPARQRSAPFDAEALRGGVGSPPHGTGRGEDNPEGAKNMTLRPTGDYWGGLIVGLGTGLWLSNLLLLAFFSL